MKKGLAVVLGVAFVVALAASVGAMPSLGVVSWDTYDGWETGDPWEGPFAYTGGLGGDIVVWYGNESGPIADTSVQVYIGCTEAGHSFNFGQSGDTSLYPYYDPATDGPNDVPAFWDTLGTNYSLSLGPVSGWTTVTDGPLVAGGGEFRILTGSWSDGLGDGQWIYAMADEGGNSGVYDNGKDTFSPPTMSTVPEPGTLLLLGSGLLGLMVFGRRKLRKS